MAGSIIYTEHLFGYHGYGLEKLFKFYIHIQLYTKGWHTKYGVNMIYDCGDMSFIFSNSKPFYCVFPNLPQVQNIESTFSTKTNKDIVLKSSGIPSDEIFSAIRVFGIVRNVHKWPISTEKRKVTQNILLMYIYM